MGISHFTKFVRKNMSLSMAKLEDFKVIVIDGNNLYHKLHRKNEIPWKMGGEYPQFYDTVKKFLQAFVRGGVKAIVVMDGLAEACKTERIKDNKLSQNKELYSGNGVNAPLLRCQTFIDVVVEMEGEKKVVLHVSAEEGDRYAAAIANSHNCPVLSDDSDFFMFELTCGVIPLYSLDIHTGSCSLYRIELLLEQFKLRDPRFRLLIPAIHGNDDLPNTIDPSVELF